MDDKIEKACAWGSAGNDDMSYFTEQFPGKVCCLCNLGERSQLGQGCMLQIKYDVNEYMEVNTSNSSGSSLIMRNKFSENFKNKALSSAWGVNYELDKVGQPDIFSLSAIYDVENVCVYVHQMCAMWTLRKSQISESDIPQFIINVSSSLTQKCTFCGQYGASITCKMNCHLIQHWPCTVASGCLLILESFTVFCKEHLSQVPIICNDNNVECLACSSLGDLSKLVMCSACGDHYHSSCVGLANLPETRTGWNCARCSKCQICRQQDSTDGRFVKCEQCQKLYHAICLRPILSSIPKFGWKCNRCRVCTDCGSRTPGGGTSSRWHSHYTICDSCYQQRNKGFSCPICQKAYRAAAYREMVKCSWCHKFVHGWCDEEADLSTYHQKKENNPDYDYVCPYCKTNYSAEPLKNVDAVELPIHEAINVQRFKDIELEFVEPKVFGMNDMLNDDFLKQCVKKKFCLSNIRGKGAKFMLHRMSVMSQIGKKRSNRGKGRQLISGGSSSDRYVNRNMESDCSNDKKMLLCSAKDKFTLAQDICVMCGSLGIEDDSAMITCAQCGQSYHPFCANVKPSKGMLQMGWRCLDCTVCEGCGKKNDEARLLLCDECDISYHIYCVNPPLDTVPHGTWKCSFCVLCKKCGRTPNEKSHSSESSLLLRTAECSACSSHELCPVCTNTYTNGEVIIQCRQCSHWSHYLCDLINKQLEIEYYDENQYTCLKCRCCVSVTKPLSNIHNLPVEEKLKIRMETSDDFKNLHLSQDSMKSSISGGQLLQNELMENSDSIHWIDGVCLSEHGVNMIKSLSTEMKRKRKMRQTINGALKDSLVDTNLAEETNVDKFKDGMVWVSTEMPLPDGFTVFTNEEGMTILRKKRQRNLQKVGIGGFSVRNRTVKKDTEDTVDHLNSFLNQEKKKKHIRKKTKNKLIEAYPAYLQEAFFGKLLLESDEAIVHESDSSDEIDGILKLHFSKYEEKTLILKNNDILKPLKTMACDQTAYDNIQYSEVMDNESKCTIETISVDSSTPEGQLIEKNQQSVDTLESKCKTFVDELECASSSKNMDKLIGKPTMVIVENYSINKHLGSENNYTTGHIYFPDPEAQNNSENHFQQHKHLSKHLQTQSTGDAAQIDENKYNEPVLEGINVGTQKTAEKMRKDEDLGLMATISAVLYANTEHSSLKDLYPNWNDRCKQILKRWRSLCNEKKAPFLQKAKDNRSALRQRREQNKLTVSSKYQKMEDCGKWKHQTKLKDNQTNLLANYSGISYETSSSVGPTVTTSLNHILITNENVLQKSSIRSIIPNIPTAQSPIRQSEVTGTSIDTPLNDIHLTNASHDIGDKKLRNLLQKNTNSVLVVPNSELNIQNDIIRLGLDANSSFNQKNSVISLSSLEQTDIRHHIHDSEQDSKNQLDLKTSESQEGISSAVVELESGFGDILGGLGEGDDDDLLKSLTSEIGDDFNILEYADPELDVNVLNTLDFEENEKGSS